MVNPQPADGKEPITIKKYANRRLYNTATSSYVTLDHLCQMVKDDIDFVVYDARSGEDITRSVLTQIIVEEEAKGTHLLPITFLRQLIGFYGDNMQWLVPRYLEQMMNTFASNQQLFRQSMQEAFGGMFSFGNVEDMNASNRALVEGAMRVFAPFAPELPGGRKDGTGEAGGGANGSAEADDSESLAKLKEQVDLLQNQLEALSKVRSED